MPRATTKDDLIKMANTQFEKLFFTIDNMSTFDQTADFCFDTDKQGKEAHWKRDRNLKDVLIHLYEWHELLIRWEKSSAAGANVPFLPSPYNWKTYGDMNIGFWQKHQNTSLERAKELVKNSHQTVMALIDRYNDVQLFTKAYFPWTGTSSLGQYCISSTVSHYDWALKKLKANSKAKGC